MYIYKLCYIYINIYGIISVNFTFIIFISKENIKLQLFNGNVACLLGIRRSLTTFHEAASACEGKSCISYASINTALIRVYLFEVYLFTVGNFHPCKPIYVISASLKHERLQGIVW